MRRHVYYYTHVEQPFEAAAGLLGADPSIWLPDPALSHGERWLVDLEAHGPLPASLATHRAAVEVSAPVVTSGALLRAVTWQSMSNDGTVPVLRADLELNPLSQSVCQLSLIGNYRPPLSVVGEAGDRVLGHRITEACVRSFVQGIADRLEAATLPV
jgi:hypothetical protein